MHVPPLSQGGGRVAQQLQVAIDVVKLIQGVLSALYTELGPLALPSPSPNQKLSLPLDDGALFTLSYLIFLLSVLTNQMEATSTRCYARLGRRSSSGASPSRPVAQYALEAVIACNRGGAQTV